MTEYTRPPWRSIPVESRTDRHRRAGSNRRLAIARVEGLLLAMQYYGHQDLVLRGFFHAFK